MGPTRKDVSPVPLGALKLAVMRGRHRQKPVVPRPMQCPRSLRAEYR